MHKTRELRLAKRMARLGTETAFEVLVKAKALEAKGRDIIHLEIGEPDFDTPGNIVDAGCDALRKGFTHYGPSAGLMELREVIAQNVSETRRVNVSPDEVVVVPGELVGHGEHFFPCFCRETEYEMSPDMDTPAGRHRKGMLEAGVIMPPVDEGQGPVVDRLEPVFHQNKMVAAKRFEESDLFRVYAVRSGADGKTDNTRIVERFAVKPIEDLDARIRIGIRLKIDDELLGAITRSKIGYPLVDLLAQ